MIATLSGIVKSLTPDRAIIEVGGVGMNVLINTTNRKGLTIQDIIEAKEYGQTVNGRAKNYEKNIIQIS